MSFRQTTAAALQARLLDLLPPGPIWPREPSGGSRLAALLLGLAEELTDAHNKILSLVDELDPRTTDDLLEDWERVAGLPDQCTPNASTLTVAERRKILTAKLAAAGGQDPAYFKSLADTITGEDCEIVEYVFQVFKAGRGAAGDPLYGNAWDFWWAISIPNVDPTSFKAGAGAAGDPLLDLPAEIFELGCLILKTKPAHTRVTFTFPNDDPFT